MTTLLVPMRNSLSRDLDTISRRMKGILSSDLDGSGDPPPFLGFPAINIALSEKQVQVDLYAPGVQRESLDLSLTHNHLTISGERKTSIPEGARIQRDERFQGKFRRLVTLPKDIDPAQVSARYENGVLRVVLGRRAPTRTKIEIE